MRPGENATVTLVMQNNGEDADLTLTVIAAVLGSNTTTSTDFLQYALTPTTAFLQQSSSTEINVKIALSGNVTNGLAIAFTVFSEPVVGNDNNFITFHVVTTTRPPPEFTENDVSYQSNVHVARAASYNSQDKPSCHTWH